MTILICDDDTVFLEMVGHMARQSGYSPKLTQTVAEALDAIEEGSYKILLTDVFLPDRDGFDLILEANRRFPELALLAMTGGKDGVFRPYKELLNAVGVIEVLEKPFGMNDLKRILDHVLTAPERAPLNLVEDLATKDPETLLLNRSAFTDATDVLARNGDLYAAAVFELVSFDRIQSVYGRDVTGDMLKQIADRLSSMPPEDMLLPSRIGQRKFGFCIPPSSSLVAGEETSERVSRLIKEFVSGIYANNSKLFFDFSAGFAAYAANAPRAGYVNQAVLALLDSQARATNAVKIYTPAMGYRARAKLDLERDLRQALEQDAITIVYQPKVSMPNREIVSFEALARWTDPERGSVSPAEFVPLAEEVGLINRLGELVLEKVAEDMLIWQELGVPLHSVAVNISPQHLLFCEYGQLLQPFYDRCLSPNLLEIEITETALMDNLVLATDTLQKLREAGVRVSIDDFGTGHSSLRYIQDLPIHCVKIDRAFVNQIGKSPKTEGILKAIVHMAQALGLSLIGEGVETEEQLDFLLKENVSTFQGYYFHKPMPPADVIRLLAGEASTAKASSEADHDELDGSVGREQSM